MKAFFLTIAVLILSKSGSAQKLVPGYYVSAAGNTVEVEIKIEKEFSKEVEVVDSAKQVRKFTPADIRGFGFSQKDKRYVFSSKPVKDGSLKFLSAFYVGSRSSLFQYGYMTSAGAGMSSKQVFYTFEKPGGQYLFLKNILNNEFMAKVREFYKEFPQAVELIDSRLKYWLDLDKDLRDILQKVNEG